MNTIFGYILLGLSLSAPIGPINAAQLDRGIKSGFMNAWLVGVGAMAADALYMMMVYMGIVHFIEIPFMKTFLYLFGAFVLIYTGIESLLSLDSIGEARSEGKDETKLKAFISGFLMSLSNPMTILFWLGIYGSVLAETAAKYDSRQLLIYSGAIIFGILLWDLTMAAVASSFRKWMTSGLLKFISMLSGLSLIGFGSYFGIQAFRLLFP
ncbi:amino acid transporter [Paenibacillus sambharensis]|uniref:Amino acid transporter n=1 Tax=Paenibacillus sambharensis TaxID=1803190 RepID=A0A2W1LSS6_9BACL|nr:LysE family transporter [Paenibacillus sambharensis]PZD94901.1 amino acid transporter [Paenibacillus sambharensis]